MSRRKALSMILATLFLTLTLINNVTQASDEVVCYDKYAQPALDHHLLQNHKIQESPSEIPKGTMRKSEWQTSETHVSKVQCPRGTIPIQKITALVRPANVNSSFVPKHEYGEVTTDITDKFYGTRATIKVWEPVVEVVEEQHIELSISQVWMTSGSYETKDLNTIEVGWQVYPGLYKDNKPRLFVYWTSDSYITTGGYNLRRPGFVQTSSKIVLGGVISPVSSIGSSQFEMIVLVWRDSQSGNWWLRVGSDLVGYWLRELFTTLADHATSISWGGEIVDSHSFGRHTKTQMGSGRFPQEGFGNASYFRNLQVVDNTCNFQLIPKLFTYEKGTYYEVKNLHRDELGTHFFFGGPGYGHRHSGVSPLRLSLLYLYFSFSLFIII